MPSLIEEIQTALFAALPEFQYGQPGFILKEGWDPREVWWFDGAMQEPDRLVAMWSEVNRCFIMVPPVLVKGSLGDKMAALSGTWSKMYTGRNWQKRLAADLVAAIVALDIKPGGFTPDPNR